MIAKLSEYENLREAGKRMHQVVEAVVAKVAPGVSSWILEEEARRVTEHVGARPRDDRLAQPEQLGPRPIVERHADGVHRFEGGAEAFAALARASRERGHLAELLGEERDDDVRLAVVHDLDDERARNDAPRSSAKTASITVPSLWHCQISIGNCGCSAR